MRDFALFEKGDDDQKTPDGMVTVVEKSSASPMERFWYRPVRAYPVVTHTHYMYGVATSGSGGGRSGDGCFAAARPFVWGLHT